jgi:hypothetical protein
MTSISHDQITNGMEILRGIDCSVNYRAFLCRTPDVRKFWLAQFLGLSADAGPDVKAGP